MERFKNKKIMLVAGIALIIIFVIIFYVAALKTSQDSMVKVVKTEHDETLKFNLLQEHSGTTFYQSGALNLTEEECSRESIPYSAVHADNFSEGLRGFKVSNQFGRDENNHLIFLGELYEWETENYDDAVELDISLDRSEATLVPADRGYILVQFYTSDYFDETESSLLIRSIVNDKKVIIKVLSDFYYSDRKSYRVIMEDYDGKNTHVLILADNVDESYIVNLIEYFAGVQGCTL